MAVVVIPNSNFEAGNVEWTLNTPWTITNAGSAFDGTWSAQFNTGFAGYSQFLSEDFIPMGPGQSITASCMCQQGASDSGQLGLQVLLSFYDSAQNFISAAQGNVVNSGSGGQWFQSSVTVSSPANTAYVRIGGAGNRVGQNLPAWIDTFTWNLEYNRSVTITSPVSGATYAEGAVVPLSVTLGGTSPPVAYVRYKYGATTIGDAPSPYNLNTTVIPDGSWAITAEAYDVNNVLLATSAAVNITIVDTTEDREFRASNSYTNLVCEDFSGLTANMPSTALVTGVELILDYRLQALIRSKDIGVADPTLANDQVLFDIVNNTSFEASLLQKDGSNYTELGGGLSATMPLTRSDFTLVEDGTSEGKKWSNLLSSPATVTLGADDALFGLTPIAAFDFATRAIGVRHIPLLQPKPVYADTGDAVIRCLLDKLRLRVYFDAGSAEYYFASPDKTQVIKGTLVNSFVETGNFRTGDAQGVLQLAPELEIMDGTQTWIGDTWTIHAAYPPTDANQIGEVDERAQQDGVGMHYNGLPGQTTTLENRSRYEFITANFFGDKNLDSIYGVNGVDRAFAYNGEEFYNIFTQADLTKDQPRHLEEYHEHLALGFNDGRVDISVLGQPWNYDGAQGASSWATGDPVTGLLTLSGTILGVFGSKSITGISGTTVDNFATQKISPKLGAIEYTVTDMSYPVYANAYGIYTLSQTQQYGDYLGSPMSQDISPWLRPRLIRKNTSDKEVSVAWPVRHKNQYRLAFSDGYVLTMTINGQQAVPTFSFQKYFIAPDEATEVSYDYRGVVPVAVSSELDESGRERIHIADTPTDLDSPTPVSELQITGDMGNFLNGSTVNFQYTISGGIPPYAVTISSGALPPGLSISSTGLVTGTLTTGGSFSWVVRAQDAAGTVAVHPDSNIVLDYWNSLDRTTIANATMSITNGSRDAEAVVTQVASLNLGVRAVQSRNSGRYYVEFDIVNDNPTFTGYVGLSTSALDLNTLNNFVGFALPSTCGQDFVGRVNVRGTNTSGFPAISTGVRAGIAIDFATQRCWVHVNGNYGGTAPTDAGGLLGLPTPVGPLFPIFGGQDSNSQTGQKVRLCLKQSEMSFFPVGAFAPFTAWGE